MALLITTPTTVKCASSTTNAIFSSLRWARIPGAPSVPPFVVLNNSFAAHFSISCATPLSNAFVTAPSIRHASSLSNSFATPPSIRCADPFAAPSADPLAFTGATAAFSTAASRAVGYDRNSASFRVDDGDSLEIRASKASRKKALADPTGRRKKDRVPDSYELIAAVEPILQKFVMYGNGTMYPFIFYVGGLFVKNVLPEIINRGPFESVLSVICDNDYHFLVTAAIPMWMIYFTILRYFLRFTPIRVYLHRDEEVYAAVYQGYVRATPLFFKAKDVRMATPNLWWQKAFQCTNWLYLKGRGAGLEPDTFKNVRDYNQMVKYARKYEDVH